jgi:hypothetical protein
MSLEFPRRSTPDNDSFEPAYGERLRIIQLIENAIQLNPDNFIVVDVRNAALPNTSISSLATLANGLEIRVSVVREHDRIRPASMYRVSSSNSSAETLPQFYYRLDATNYENGIYADDAWSETNTSAIEVLKILEAVSSYSLPEWALFIMTLVKVEINHSLP